MKVTKKTYIFSAIALLVVVSGFLIIKYTINTKDKSEEAPARELKSVFAVPVDAIAVYVFDTPLAIEDSYFNQKSFFSKFIRRDNPLYRFVNKVNFLAKSETAFKQMLSSDALTSVHYSAKSEVSLLFCLTLGNEQNVALLTEKLLEEAEGVSERKFNGAVLYSVKGVDFTIYKGFLIASTSPILTESSVRHLNSSTSIMDNPDFERVSKGAVFNDNILFINHQNLGKLFSGLVTGKYLGYADFASKLSSWSIAEGEFQENSYVFKGEFLNFKGVGNFTSAFSGMTGADSRAYEILPFNTFISVSMPVLNFDSYLLAYRGYRELNKRLNPEVNDKGREWFLSLNPQEVTIASIPYGSNLEWVSLIRMGKPSGVKKFFASLFSRSTGELKDSVLKYKHKSVLKEVFGSIFDNCREESYCIKGDWMIIGPSDLVTEFSKGKFLNFTMENFIDQTPVAGKIDFKGSPLSVVINATGMQDSVASFFKPLLTKGVESVLKQANLEFASFRLLPEEGKLKYELILFAQQVDKLPAPKVVESGKPAGWEKDSVVKVPAGPFEVKNFNNGETEYLIQLPNFKLQLADKDKKGIWTVPFTTPLRGYVEQVDMFGNGKLQMLFASGNQLFLLDRLGRFVNPYPKRVKELVLIGPKIYKTGDNGEFSIMLLHTDNTLRLYDKECRPFDAWIDITAKETIKTFPELIKAGKNRYWVLRTVLKTRIYTINGIEVTRELKRFELLPNTPVKVVSENEVIVKVTGNKNYKLNLETGETKKVK